MRNKKDLDCKHGDEDDTGTALTPPILTKSKTMAKRCEDECTTGVDELAKMNPREAE